MARGAAGAVAAEAAEALRRRGLAVEVQPTQHRGDGVRLARDAVGSAVSVVISVGGDGTAREVAEGLATSPDAPPLLILPAGTGNSMHKALWSDLTWEATLDAALSGAAVTRRLDLIRIVPDGPAVLLGASAGFLRWAVEATSRFPDLTGRDLYASAGLAAAQELKPFTGRVSVDGRLLAEGPIALAAVGGAQRRGGSLLLFPRSRLDDGLLDVCVLTATGPDDAIPLLLAATEGAHLGMPGVLYTEGREVSIESLDDAPLPFEHDGDLWPGDDRSLRLAIVPAAVPALAAP